MRTPKEANQSYMRSSKSRSRSKSNRNRSVGNIVNRVFNSSGPEGKVRGTPQQIIDKYNQLARDAQLSNDRVAFENFQQHSEHYTRMLAEAQREQDARREQEFQGRDRQQGRPDDELDERGRDDRPQTNGHDAGEPRVMERVERAGEPWRAPEPERRPEIVRDEDRFSPSSEPVDVIDTLGESDSTLVETPESRPPRPRRRRRPQADQAETTAPGRRRGRGGRIGRGPGLPPPLALHSARAGAEKGGVHAWTLL